MKLRFLGTGTSNGVPVLGCQCEVCKSADSHDKRLRTAALIEADTGERILIDCGPDIRQQLLPLPFKPIDAVLLTHLHYDHVGGLDDLRPYCKFGDMEIYANHDTIAHLKQSMPYCFADNLYPGVPRLCLHEVCPHQAFKVGKVDVMPFEVMHAHLPILGFRIGKLAYITDMLAIDDAEWQYLSGIDTLIVNALRFQPNHHSHITIAQAVAFAQKIAAKQTYFVHMNHEVGLHARVNNGLLPAGIQLAYDGLEIAFL